jgi:nucleoside-diphosphate-sugar epimerase/glycosyltransferase involved in cell wall biosynthesis
VTSEWSEKITRLQGPVLVLGASGFVGANILRSLLAHRSDAYGTYFHAPAWRLEGLPETNLVQADLLVDANLDAVLDDVAPRTIFNCIAYGAYPFETDGELIYETNFNLTVKLLRRLESRPIACYVHSGSSSEYGDGAAGPHEDDLPQPNSDYAVSKVACANLLRFYGRKKKMPCANLRLFSAYGPLEDSSRLIPTVVTRGLEGDYPPFVNRDISRDFVYIDDVVEAYVDTALNLKSSNFGDSFNIGSGQKTTIGDVAATAADLFAIDEQPSYDSMQSRTWDIQDWYSDQTKTAAVIGWAARTKFADGLRMTMDWYRGLEDSSEYLLRSKRFGLDPKHSVSAIIACYKDGQAIPIMYERLKRTFEELQIDYEIIFVNDNSPDDSEEVIRAISAKDRRVIGISHARNFGSQAAFRSGMEIASKNACVLLDGDLQDPPELIAEFVAKWREGYDVVYGRRVKRAAPLFMRIGYKLFYRVFDAFSFLSIPHDAGDFSLIDAKVMKAMLQYPERDLFLRGIRASAGFKQTGVDYVRPERMFGRTTNSLPKNIAWAKKGILSFSYTPLSVLTFVATLLLVASMALALVQLVLRIVVPDSAPKGITTLLLAILFFGSINLLAIATVGEYVAKILEESKRRPHFIRRAMIRRGEVRAATGPVDRSSADVE